MDMYIGFDVHCKQTTYWMLDERGKELGRGRVPTSRSAIRSFLKTNAVPEGTKIGLESGAQAHWMTEVLMEAKMSPVVIDAEEVRAKQTRRGQKDDFRDARDICDGLRRDQWQRIVWFPPYEIRQARRLLSRRRYFVKGATREINAAKFIMRSLGMGIKRSCLASERGWNELIDRQELSEDTRTYLRMHFAVWQQLQMILGQLEKELEELMAKIDAPTALIQSFPMIGPITTAGLVAAIGDPARFPTSNHVVSYVGLAPSRYDSGDRKCEGGITRQGSTWLRALLVQAAHQARRPTHPLNPYYRRLSAQKGVKCAIVAIAAHLLRILWRMWRDNTTFDINKLNVQYRPHAQSKLVYYELKKPQGATHGRLQTSK